MSVTRFGDFAIEDTTWLADSELVAHRTERWIRSGDPDYYRLFLSVEGGERMEQAGNQTDFRARDIAFYDMSSPCHCFHTVGLMRVIMLTFPRESVPMIARNATGPIIGTAMPRNLPGRDLLAHFLVELADPTTAIELDRDSEFTDLLPEITAALIRQRLGQTDGMTTLPQLLQMARVHAFVHRNLDDPHLDPRQIAEAVNMSLRALHQLFQDNDDTPMRLVKRLRLEKSRRDLEDSAQATTLIKEIGARHGYARPERFTRDFKQKFGSSPREVRP